MDIVFKIAGIGIAVTMIEAVLNAAGKAQWAQWVSVIAFIAAIYMGIEFFSGALDKIWGTLGGLL